MELIKQDILFGENTPGPSLSEDEKAVVSALFSRSNEDIDICIPEDIDVPKFLSWMNSTVKINMRLNNASKKLRPILGRFFQLVKNRPDIQQALGVKNISFFLNSYVPNNFHMTSAEAWSCLRIGEDYPDISVTEYEAVGYSKLKLIAKAIPADHGEITASVKEKRGELMGIASGMKYLELADKIEEMGIAQKDDILAAKIVVKTSKLMSDAWKEFCEDPRIIQYVGSEDPKVILERALAECYSMWITHVEAGGE
jgi:hypothetical protein